MLQLLPQKQKPDYDDFYKDNYNRVVNYVKNKINNYEDAEDLASEVFLYCYSHYEEYDSEKSGITTWLYLIVNSRIKNYYRDHISNADIETVQDVMADESIDMDEGIYLEQLHKVLTNAIKMLPETDQKIVMMTYFENKSGEQIARTLGITPGNVRVKLHRALGKLQKMNDGYWKEYRNNG